LIADPEIDGTFAHKYSSYLN